MSESGAKRPRRETNHDLYVAGIGASAGGIEALEKFFESLPATSGMAFVIVLHLPATHESNLAALLQRHTEMPVVQLSETTRIEPNHVYVIPPANHLVMSDGEIRLVEPMKEIGRRVPIDVFFRTLAQEYKRYSVGIVLSGTGSDGTMGLRHIKEGGGITFAQDPVEAKYDGMPLSAINTGAVDFVLPVARIPEKLAVIRETAKTIHLPAAEDELVIKPEADTLREILLFLRVRTGNDFLNYKPSTVLRRIGRRMQVNGLATLAAYLLFLREHTAEVQSLLNDLLITVTNFFRDPDAFEVLEREVIPKIFEMKGEGEQVRVWVAGCATGEEAYSLAILLQEYANQAERSQTILVFATDIDDESIDRAREGLFPDSIAVDVTPERLKRFFTKEGHHYRIKREIREMVLFATHNVLRDPPFSKLDLISCRNMLIYLDRGAQERVLQVFHFALSPNAFLFLGSSESADSLPDLFAPVDKKLRIFKRNPVSTPLPSMPAMPLAGWRERHELLTLPPAGKQPDSYDELHQVLLEQYAPPSVLVNQGYDIVHLSDNAGRYLRFAGGLPTRNLLKVVHPDLRLVVRAALFEATQKQQPSQARRVFATLDGEPREVGVIVRPILQPETARGYLLVIFDEPEWTKATANEAMPPTVLEGAADDIDDKDAVVRRLEEDLQRTKDELRITVEQYETSTEELKASNEELQAINEELHSTTEELETNREELQSVNEELITVNQELKEKVEEVSQTNADLQNFLTSTDIGTIFLDRDFRIKRFTPHTADLFNLIPGDAGRPLTHLTHRLEYPGLMADAEGVLVNLVRVEREVRSVDGRWYIARIVPYRTMEDRIDGVVLTFVDITARRQAEDRTLSSEEYLRTVVESIRDYAIMTTDLKGYITGWNTGAELIFGYTSEEIVGNSCEILFTPEDRENRVPEIEMQTARAEGRAMDERWHLRKDGSRFYASGVLTLLHGDSQGFVKVLRDLTEQRQAQEELHQSHVNLEQRVKERTRELQVSYQSLQEEVNERRVAESQVKELLRRIVTAQEQERQRIALDLHDILGQQLTALRLKLESLKEQCEGQEELCAQIEQSQQIARELDSEVDFLAWELRPAALAELGLTTALEGYVQDWVKHFNLCADFHTSGLDGMCLTSEVESNLYRIAQEALNNIVKHAAASRADVLLEYRNRTVILVVEDDGKGFDPNEINGPEAGLGLIGMRERAGLIGGTLEIESTPGSGTTIFARIPLYLNEREEQNA